MTDPHGQPFNVRFNRARRAERDLCELLGLAKGLLSDGEITRGEAEHLADWVAHHPDAAEQWPVNRLAERLLDAFADGHIDEDERADLSELLTHLVGGTAGIVCGEDAATELPLDEPPPPLSWSHAVYVFTGKFAYGTRATCERAIASLGAIPERTVTKRTDFLVIGTFGSRDWVHTSFGRKILKAVEYRDAGVPLAIVSEEHWIDALQPAG
jgi:hypothetical protein